MPALMTHSITYRGIERTDAIDAYVHKRAERLVHAGSTVHSCRVVIDGPPKHKHHGGHYFVRIEVSTSLGSFVVDRDHGEQRDAEDLYAAIDASFDRGVRRLHDDAARTASAAQRTRA
jgi:ribosome-associated translation inhibitor RaiA